MISRMEWAAGRKLRANAGETLTEVLISVLVIALGMTMFLSAFLASGRMLQQGEEQMAGYYDSRNQLENNRTAKQASGRYVLELEASGTGVGQICSGAGSIWNRRHEEKPGVKCLPDRHTDELPDGTVSDRAVYEPG